MSLPEPDINKVIVVALERLAQAFRVLLWDYAKKVGLSPIQIQFLVYIAGHPMGQSFVNEIAQEFNLTAPTVSDAIKSLEKKGLVSKQVSSRDHRKYFVKLTASGKKVASNLSDWHKTLIEHLRSFPLATRETVMTFLLELVESLKNGDVLKEVKTCLSCKYFVRDAKTGSEKPHLCLLRDIPLANIDMRLDCPNYKPTDDDG